MGKPPGLHIPVQLSDYLQCTHVQNVIRGEEPELFPSYVCCLLSCVFHTDRCEAEATWMKPLGQAT